MRERLIREREEVLRLREEALVTAAEVATLRAARSDVRTIWDGTCSACRFVGVGVYAAWLAMYFALYAALVMGIGTPAPPDFFVPS